MTKATLKNGWKLYILEINEDSPLENHKTMEIAADDERKNLFAHEIMVITHGLDSVVNSCNKYADTRKG